MYRGWSLPWYRIGPGVERPARFTASVCPAPAARLERRRACEIRSAAPGSALRGAGRICTSSCGRRPCLVHARHRSKLVARPAPRRTAQRTAGELAVDSSPRAGRRGEPGVRRFSTQRRAKKAVQLDQLGELAAYRFNTAASAHRAPSGGGSRSPMSTTRTTASALRSGRFPGHAASIAPSNARNPELVRASVSFFVHQA